MTAEVDVHRDACESELSKVVEDGNEIGNGNGNKIGNGNGAAKDDADGSYVFVTGSDAMDPIEADLDGSLQNNGGGLHLEGEGEVGEVGAGAAAVPEAQGDKSHSHSHLNLNDGELLVFKEGGEGILESHTLLQSDKEPLQDSSRDLGQESDHDLHKHQLLSNLGDDLSACHTDDTTPPILAQQSGQVLPAPVISEIASIQLEANLETLVVNGPASDENGDALPTDHAQESIADPLVSNDFVHTPQENWSCENAQSYPFPSVSDKVPIESGESFTTVSDNNAIVNPAVENGVPLPTENVSTCAVDDVRPETDVVKFDDKSSEVPNPCPFELSNSEIEAERVTFIDDTLSSCSANDAISEPNSKSEIEAESATVIDGTLSSFPATDAISEIEAENAPIVDCTLSSCSANDAISEPNSKSEIEAESAAVIDDTLSSCPANDAISEANSKSEIEAEDAPVIDDTLSCCPANDAISEANSKSEIEAEDAPVVDDSLSSCPANDAISEPNSKSEIEAEDAPVIDETLSSCPANDAISESNSKSEFESESAPMVDDFLSSCAANDAILEPNSKSEVESESAPVVDDFLSSCVANDAILEPNSKSDIESESSIVIDDSQSSYPTNDAISEPKTGQHNIDCEEKVSNDAMYVDSGLPNVEAECAASPLIYVADSDAKLVSQINGSVEDEASLPAIPDADDRPGSEVQSTSTVRSRDVLDDNGNASESRVLNHSSVENGRTLNCILDDVQSENVVKSTCQEVECTDRIHRSEASTTSSPEVSIVDPLEGQNKGADAEKRPFYFLIRIPRYDDENLKEQIQSAQLLVEEKTKSRDAIRSKIQMKRAICKEYVDNVEAARSEERAARDLFKSKRQEMDSVQFMINKVKNAISVEDMDNRIRHMEHVLEHETVPLKEEKQFIREIKQLKQLREQLYSNIGKQDEVQQALDQKDDIEKRLKVLRKEMDLLRDNLLKAEAITQAAKKKFNEENDLLNELFSQFRAADDIRQEAYADLQSLRKQQYEKNKYFWRYKDDTKAANNLALSGDREKLQHFCINQVETMMELWNNNDDFRKEYIRCNTRSTLRRLRTLDGRSLGPDEEPPVIPEIVRATKVNLATVVSTPEQAKRVALVEAEKPDFKSAMKVVEQKNEIPKTKKPVKHASSVIGPETVSGRKEIEDERVEDQKPTKEEEELARRAEELRKEEEAARLREQRRVEEKTKAKEALERKKKTAEKAQARAAIRAQKEAEEKEKEREKKVRKKERKKATTTKATNGIIEGESAPEPSSEIPIEAPKETEIREKPNTITKRSQKLQTKVKPIPPPLRNRSKRRMQPWMWVLIAILVILAMFLLGNGGSSSFKSLLKKVF